MDKKELIRKTAIKIIAKYGYHNTKVQMIADEAGIANGTVYHYFKSKQEIFEYIIDVELEKRLRYLAELDRSEGNTLKNLESFMNYLFKEWEDDFDVLRVLMQDGIFLINYEPNIRKMFDKLNNGLAQLITKGSNSGELKEIDANSFAFIILNLLRGAIYEFKFDSNTDNYAKKKNQLIDFILDGIRKR